jgi:hypothetical protein
MRSAGCVINDMWDSDLDKKVYWPSNQVASRLGHFSCPKGVNWKKIFLINCVPKKGLCLKCQTYCIVQVVSRTFAACWCYYNSCTQWTRILFMFNVYLLLLI